MDENPPPSITSETEVINWRQSAISRLEEVCVARKLRGSFIVGRESRKHKDFVAAEMLLISVLLGWIFKSWVVWFVAFLLLSASLGTIVGKIIGVVISVAWGGVAYIFASAFDLGAGAPIVIAICCFGISWYAHNCGNIYWKDFGKADWS